MQRLSMMLAALVGQTHAYSKFWVAEVKPHYGCTDPGGQAAVQKYIDGLVTGNYGLIALLQIEFRLNPLPGYSAFWGSCHYGKYNPDPAIMMVKTDWFDFIKGFSNTYTSQPPYVNGWTPVPPYTTACSGNPSIDGERSYTGALLRHKSSGVTFCAIAGTLPHKRHPAGSAFENELRSVCGNYPKVLVLDTNDELPMTDKGNSAVAGGWGTCSDWGQNGPPTCCNDYQRGKPYAQFKYDRTAICGGGHIEHWEVNKDFICKAEEEHLFTRAYVALPVGDEAANATLVV